MTHRAVVACALFGLLGACSTETDPLTEIVVVVDSDFSGLTRFEAEIEGFEEPSTVTAELDEQPLPRRFSLVHDGGPLGPMAVTVRAYTDGDEPILVEPRTGMFFKAGQTQLLKIDLLSACVGLCEEDQACIAPGECVSSAEAAVLVPWSGQPDGLDVGGPLDGGMDSGMMGVPDGSMNEAGMVEDSGRDADAPEPDSGPREDADVEPDAEQPDDAAVDASDGDVPEPEWPYVPSNVELDDGVLASLPRSVLLVDCALATIDSTTPEDSDFCHAAPAMVVLTQPDGGEILVVPLSLLQVDAGMKLKLVGSRPVLFLVEGDASIAGAIDASADGAVAGPGGADATACAGSTGGTGNDSPSGVNGASGGSGGGFGSAGSASGASNSIASVLGGTTAGDGTLVPLRGGCSGGAGGLGKSVVTNAAAGGGGGAVQLSVWGTLSLTGSVNASGDCGAPGQGAQGGGGGGGSGGAVLLEASSYSVGATAVIAVNGGAGGGGQPGTTSTPDSTPGGDGEAGTTQSIAGGGSSNGGDGGRGGALAGHATNGGAGVVAGTCFPIPTTCNYGGGGGGAGGVGRVRIVGAGGCAFLGTYSPAPIIDCESCLTACPVQPDISCVARAAAGRLYSVCASAVSSTNARALCQSADLDLAKIEGQTENDYLLSQVASDSIIGASDLVEDNWRWVVDDTAFWSGDEDGDVVGGAFEAWRTGEPNGSGDCARITSEGWADISCDDPYPFICERP